MKEIVIWGIVGMVIGVGIVYGALKASDRSEIAECKQWQEYAGEYDTFYLTSWQDTQCRAHNIIINAPIK